MTRTALFTDRRLLSISSAIAMTCLGETSGVRWRLLPPLLVLMVSSCVSGSTEPQPQLPRNGNIAFLKTERLGPVPYDVRQGIYLVDPDGAGILRLLEGPDGALYGRPSWSPDGTQIAFPRLDTHFGPTKLLVVRSDGKHLTSIHSCRGTSCAWEPHWSRDGDSFAFVGGLNIYTMDAGGGNPEQLTHCPPDGSCYIIDGLSWSPDETSIAFARMDRQWVGAIYVMDADGSDLLQLTSCYSRLCKAGQRDAQPAWSPDGTKIAFVREQRLGHGGHRPEGAALDHNCPTRYRFVECTASFPAWSPDGTKILFVRAGWIYVMNADGTQIRKLVEGLLPAWQPLTDVE